MAVFVEIINTGNELLDGRIPNSNGQWMAKRCAARGVPVRRITMVGDRLDDLRDAIREALARGPALLLLTGGLGPTPDDITARALAEALEKQLVLSREALEMLREFYGGELTPAREKMAWLPEGARPLRNPVGAAPGILIEHGITKIVALPGVPKEMEAMFEEHVEPILAELAGGLSRFEARFLIYGVRESDIADFLGRLAEENPDVYVKTHPRIEDGRTYLELYVATVAPSGKEAKKRMEKVIMALSEHIAGLGGSMMPYRPKG